MDAKTLEALKGSIAKWETVRETLKQEGVTDCPLCQLFYNNGCKGCPVSKKTRQINCCGTPFKEFYKDPSVARAQAELDFLKSLLPKDAAK